MKDIQSKEDIALLVNSFYTKVMADPIIGHFFTAADFSLEKHLPIIISFWETILLDVITYSGNPMLKHISMNENLPLKKADFERWLLIWEETLTENFAGEKADEALKRGKGIAHLMDFKINGEKLIH
ncbi:MAG: group III truncated hemoglobin [Janthinobacterium lividum]